MAPTPEAVKAYVEAYESCPDGIHDDVALGGTDVIRRHAYATLTVTGATPEPEPELEADTG